MKRLLSHLVARVKESWNRPTSRPQRFTQLKLEGLEDRLVPSTTEYVNPAALFNFNNVYGDFWSAYNAAQPGDTIQLEPGATIAGGTINKPGLTIRGDPGYSANNYTVTGNVEVTQNGFLTNFKNLDFGQNTLTLDANADVVGVEYSLVGQINSYANDALIYGNTVQGMLTFHSLGGNGGGNNVSGNTFVGIDAQVSMENGINDAVNNNTFQVTSNTDIFLADEQGAVVANNQIYNTGDAPDPYGIVVSNDQNGQGTNVQIVGNVIQTGNLGVGLVTYNSTESTSMNVWVQGNNFGGNAIGVLIVGDGISPGNINLGVYGNPGGNDFSDYQGGDGRLAIAVVDPADTIVWAQNNTWGTNPGDVVKDSTFNTCQQIAPSSVANQIGTGDILF